MEESALADLVTARDHLRGGGCTIEKTADTLELRCVVQGSKRHVVIRRIAGLRVPRLVRERRHEIIVDPRSGQHTRGCGAVLPRIEIPRHGHGLRGARDVGVVEHDDRRLPAQLEVHAFQVGARRARHIHPCAHAAGYGRHRRQRVRDQRGTSLAVATDHVEDSRRQVLGHDLRHQQRGHRGRVRRFEHHCIPGGDGRRPLPHRHQHRVVPRRHLGAHADRFTADERRVPRHVLTGAAPFEDARAAGEEADGVEQHGDLLAARQREGLARVLTFQRDELVSPGFKGVCDAQQRQAAVLGSGVAPAFEGARGSSACVVDVVRTRHGRTSELFARRRVDQRQRARRSRVATVAIDEVAQRAQADDAHAVIAFANSRKLSTYIRMSSAECCTDSVQFSSAPGAIKTPRLSWYSHAAYASDLSMSR